MLVYGFEIKHISTGLVILAHCIMPTIKSVYIKRHEKNDTLDIKMAVRRLYISFILSKLFSAHAGDMLVGVLNKKDVQKNKRSAFLKWKDVCDAIFDEGSHFLEWLIGDQGIVYKIGPGNRHWEAFAEKCINNITIRHDTKGAEPIVCCFRKMHACSLFYSLCFYVGCSAYFGTM